MSNLNLFFPTQSCEDAIRTWVEIRIRRQVPLQGGVSGASIFYVDAEISFPGLETEPNNITCVIKYSTEESFEAEKKKYDKIPEQLKHWFASLEAPRVMIDGEFFMIMPFLNGYQTLSSLVYYGKKEQVEYWIKKILDCLENIHFFKKASEKLEEIPSDKFSEFAIPFGLYLTKIQESIEKSQGLLDTFPELQKEVIKINGVEYRSVHYYLDQVPAYLKELLPRFYTRMHGDCHPRNLLIKPKNEDIKIIDIDKMSDKGDYINDYGTLLADMQIFNCILQARRPNFRLSRVNGAIDYTLEQNCNANDACRLIFDRVKKTAIAKGDSEEWERRLELAEARYLFSMVPKTLDKEKACLVYCEALKSLANVVCKQEFVYRNITK